MVEELLACARECGVSMRRFAMIYSVPAAPTPPKARDRGVPSTTVIAMPTNVFRGNLVYHTRDVVEHVEPAVVEACMRITAVFLHRMENGKQPMR